MQLEAARPMDSANSEPQFDLDRAVAAIASEIARLDPGPAAELRRETLGGAGAAAFWKLMATHGPARHFDEDGWAAVVQAIAVLTPNGRNPEKPPAHDRNRPMGAALHDGGISELRLARLLAASKEMRRDPVLRTCRRLAAAEECRFDLRTLARFILFDDDRTSRRIASDYYRAEARATRVPDGKETSSDD